MKKQIIITFLLVMTAAQFLYAQKSTVPADNLNVNLMKKYVGTWQWKSAGSSFTMVIKIKEIATKVYMLYGWCQFQKNGEIIIDGTSKTDSVKYAKLAGYITNDNDTVRMTFTDETRNYGRTGKMYFINADQNKFFISLDRNGYHKRDWFTDNKKLPSEKLPVDLGFVLTKVN